MSANFSLNAKMATVVVAVFAVLALGAPATAEEYEVQPGDSLSEIARDYSVTTAELAAENGISDLHLIRVGQVLRIPGPVFYTVTDGDTIGGIAVALGVSRAELIELNKLDDPHLIQIGQQLQIPGSVAVDPAARYSALPERLVQNPERSALIPSFEKWAAHYGVPPDLLMAMAYRESGWQRDVVSFKDAIGVGQLLPGTAEWVANDLIGIPELDPFVADDNIRMSARLLQWLIGYMGGEDLAIAAYYQGPGSVQGRGLYDDTEEYVDNVQQIRGSFVPQ